MTQTETPRAILYWSSPEKDAPGAAAAAAFAAARYRPAGGDGAGADLGLFDVRAGAHAPRAAVEAAQRFRSKSPEAAIVYVGSEGMAAAERAHLRRHGELVFAGADLQPVVSACRQRLRIRNIAEEAGERLKSIAAQSRLSEFAPIVASNDPPSLLLAGAPGPLMMAMIRAAGEVADRCDAALSAGQAMRALETGDYDCLALAPKDAGDPLLGLARAIRRRRSFQDLPMILVRPPQPAAWTAAAPPGAETMPAAHVDADLGRRAVQQTRRARLAAAMRRFLQTSAGDGVRDPISGAFTAHFLGAHGARLLERADQTGRPVSLVGVRLRPEPLAPKSAGSGRACAEAARLLRRVTRAEDFLALLSADTFVLFAAATVGADAALIARRAEGVIANTMFRSRSGADLFATAAATAAIERPPGRRIEETIAGLIAALNAGLDGAVRR